MIVDTVNEIAGDGDIPHPCVGEARRMMVPSLAEQGGIMEECVQNHSPDVIIVDKLGHPEDVEAARACKDQDVRLVASMNGTLPKLLKNGKLQGLLGVEGRPLHRTAAPTFDLIVELCPGTRDEWKVILNTTEAVDVLLTGEKYSYQHRVHNAVSGSFSLKTSDA